MDRVLAVGYDAWLQALVNLVDRAMAAEGVDPDVRDRVVEQIYGAPLPVVELAPAPVFPPVNVSGM